MANIARLQQDMARATSTVEGAMTRIRNSAGSAVKALGAIGVGLSVAGIASFIKGAIDAADETSKLAQKIGVSTKEVAGLQLAFRQAGASDAFVASMARLSKGIAGGNDGLVALGINTRNTDGTLKSSRVVLGEVADQFAKTADGAAKTARAQEIFGKAGADLIPLLNAGSQALAEYDALAAKLGLTLSDETAKQAEAFNDTLDLVGQGVQGVGTQIAAQLLPTLTGLAGEFFNTFTAGDRLKNTADFLASTLKVLYSAGIVGIEIFSSLGKTIGGVAAAIVAALSGNFGEAKTIIKELSTDVSKGWKDALAQIDRAWNTTGNNTVSTLASVRKAQMTSTEETKKNAKAVDEYGKLVKKLQGEIAKSLAEAEAAQNGYNKAQTEFVAFARSDVFAKLSASQKVYVTGLFEQKIVSEQVTEATKELAKAQDEAGKNYTRYLEDLNRSVQTQRDRITGLEDEARAEELAASLNISLAQAVELVNIAKLKEQQINALGNEDDIASIQREIEARERILKLTENKDVREANKKAADDASKEWERFYEDLERGLTDSLFRAFESGKGFFSTLWDGIKNLFKTTVLKLAIQGVVGGVLGAVGLGTASAGDGGTSVGGVLNAGSSLVSLATNGQALVTVLGQVAAGTMSVANAAGTLFANYTRTGIDGLLATNNAFGTGGALQGSLTSGATALGGALVGAIVGNIISGGYSAIGKNPGTAVALGTAIGGAVGTFIFPGLGTAFGAALGGVIGGVVNRVFGRKLTEVGIQGTFAESGFSGNAYSYEKGGLFRSNRERNLGPVDNETTNLLNQAFSQVKNTVAGLAQQLGVGRDAIDGFTTSIRLNFKGLNDDQINELLNKTFTDIGNTLADFVLDQTAGLKELAIRGETSIETLTRLAEFLSTINGVVDFLNIGMFDLSVAGVRAAESFVQLFGGLENFAAVTSVYAENFFSEAEKQAIKIERLADTFRQLDAAGAFRDTAEEYQRLLVEPTRESFRALVEAQDLNTEAGRSTTAALLALSGAVAEVTPVLDAATESVNGLARAGITLVDVYRQAESVADAFLNEAELRAFRITRIQQELAAGGILVSAEQIGATTMAQFRQYIGQALAVGTPEALASVSVLLNVADAFIALQPAGQQAIDAVDGLTAAAEVMAQRVQLEIQLMRAAGNEAGALARERQLEIDALAPSNQALQQHIYAIEDAQAAVQAATAAYEQQQAAAREAAQAQVSALQEQQSAAQSALQALEQDASRWLSIRDRAQTLLSGIGQSLGNPGNREAELNAVLNGAGTIEERLQAAEQLKSLYEQTASVQNTAAQQALSNAQQMVNLGRQLRDYVQSLRVGDLSALTPAQKLAEAQAQYQATLTAAQGGDALAQGRLQGVADTFLRLAREFDPGSYSTDVFPTVTGQLDGFSGMLLTEGEAQTAIQQAILDTANTQTGLSAEQIAKLTALQGAVSGLLSQAQSGYAGAAAGQAIAQAQLSAISSQLQAAQATASAIASQSAAMDAGVIAAQNNLLAVQQQANSYLASIAQAVAAGGGLGQNGQPQFDPARAQIIRDYAAGLPQDESGVRQAIEAAQANGVSSAELDAALGYAPGTSNQAAIDRGYPAFARGGDFAGGVRLVGERGPELELTGPSRIFSAQQTRQIVGGDQRELVTALRSLVAEVRELKAEVNRGNAMNAGATERNTQVISRTIEKAQSLTGRAAELLQRRTVDA